MMVTSHRESLETLGSHLINRILVCVHTNRQGAWFYFTAALRRWSEASAINKANGYWLMPSNQDMRCLIDSR